MVDLQATIDETKPLITEFLLDAKIIEKAEAAFMPGTMVRFSDWFTSQVIEDKLMYYCIARIAAYIGNYQIENNQGQWVIRDNKIYIRSAVDYKQGVYREYCPYELAMAVVNKNITIKQILA
jgi:hypothetical protein